MNRFSQVHISFDDVYVSIVEIKNKKNIFENVFFAWLKELHEKYDCVFSLYIQNWGGILREIQKDQFEELGKNYKWLKLGIHTSDIGMTFDQLSYEAGKANWEHFVTEIIRIGGNEYSIDRMPRLHTFAGSYEALLGMGNADICAAVGFLAADDSRKSYYLSEKSNRMLYEKGVVYDEKTGLMYMSTDFRLDWLGRTFCSENNYYKPKKHNCYKELTERFIKKEGYEKNNLIVFTHEWQIYNKGRLGRKKKWVEDVCKFADKNGLGYGYPMDTIYMDT